jgi:hypothetical protein
MYLMYSARPQMKKTKLAIAVFGIASLVTAIVGGFLFNPFCIGAGVAGLFLSCGMAVSLKKPTQGHPYV